ncbi:MAG TPA: phosphatase PAP2 family protein [Tepidisphaeraceae bacterium]|jgi:hypothetical protein|nr:phosphatase PAP2 family protein [Tepidisphaeraceae bacterium]
MPDGSSNSPPAPSCKSFARRLWRRIFALWKFKALLTLAITTLFCIPYFLLGNFPIFPVHDLPSTWIDRKIGFHPYAWVWIYQSLYPLLNALPWLADRRADLLRYAKGFALLSIVCFTVYAVFPTRSPKPMVEHARGMYAVLRWYDTPLNALPSLHAGLCVYTLAFGWRLFRGKLPAWLGALFVAWGGLILYGTLATKEHYLVDIVSGALIAIIADAIVWHGHFSDHDSPQPYTPSKNPRPRHTPDHADTKIRDSSGRISQAGRK